MNGNPKFSYPNHHLNHFYACHTKPARGAGLCLCRIPETRIYDKPAGKSIQHLIFGDYITPPKKPSGNGYKKWTATLVKEAGGEKWINVRSRQEDGWMKLGDLQLNRTLEINFVDIGQGDGCHMVTPADEHFVIDAGEGR